MRLKNKSLEYTSYVTGLGSLRIPKNSIVNVPIEFTERQVREAIAPFEDLVLLDGYVLNQDDIIDGKQLDHEGVMTKDVYDINLNNIVDLAEEAIHGGGGGDTSSIEVSFNASSFSLVSLNIGILKAHLNIEEIKLIIDTPFDAGAVSVGDVGNHARLMSEGDSDITFASTYIMESEYVYSVDTQTKIYFSGSPTVGSGRIIIFSS